jgi:hypothetical protein
MTGVDRLPKPLPRATLGFRNGRRRSLPRRSVDGARQRHTAAADTAWAYDIALWEIHEAFSALKLCHIKAFED